MGALRNRSNSYISRQFPKALNTTRNFANSLPNKAEAIIWALSKTIFGDPEVFLKDAIGRQTFTPVRPVEVIGDGFTYFDVYKKDGVTPFTDADLPTNYTISGKDIFASTIAQEGIFGFNSGGVDRYYLMAYTDDTIRLGIYDTIVTTTKVYTEGQLIEWELIISGLNYQLWINNVMELSGTFVKTLGNTQLQLNSLGEDSSTSECNKISFKITNTDTNETIMSFNGQTLIREGGGFNDYLTDSSGNDYYAQQMVQPATPAQYNDELVGSELNESGYELARALGTNLLNQDNYIVGFIAVDGSFDDSPGFRTGRMYVKDIEVKEFVLSASSNRSIWRSLDKNGDYIEGSRVNAYTYTAPSNAMYVECYYLNESVSIPTNNQVQVGSVETAYEAWEGYYIDEALTIPFADGSRIDRLGTTANSIGWMSDGEGGAMRAPCDLGRVKDNPQVIDGVVDNGVDYENWGNEELDSGITIGADFVRWVMDGNFQGVQLDAPNMKTSTLYTVVFNVTETTVLSTTGFQLDGGTGIPNADAIIDITTTGEKRMTFTSKSTITTDTFRFVAETLTSGQVLQIEDVTFYEGDYVTGTPTLPTSGAYVTGNSLVLDTAYNDAVQADTAEYLFDKTDPENVESKVFPIATTGSFGDYWFVGPNGCALYDSAQDSNTIAEIGLKLGFSQPLLTSTGAQVTDSDGKDLYVLAEGAVKL